MMTTKQFLTVLSLVALFSGAIRSTCGSAVLIADQTMSVMVELSSRHPFCKMHTDRGDIQRMLLQSDPRRIRQVPRDSVMELENVCKDAGSYGREFRGGLGFIYPGTKWCGPGTAAVDYNDLGQHADEDRCCREHDLCPNVLSSGECRRGLCNTGAFTRSHCDCDARFRRCLQSLNTETANTLGAIFYNVVQVTCFQERSPCSPHQRFDQLCPVEFRPSNLYIPPDSSNLISRIVQKHSFFNGFSPHNNFNQRSFHGEKEQGPSGFESITTRLGVKIASVGLAAVNIFKELKNNWPQILGGQRNSNERDVNFDEGNHLAGNYYQGAPQEQQYYTLKKLDTIRQYPMRYVLNGNINQQRNMSPVHQDERKGSIFINFTTGISITNCACGFKRTSTKVNMH